MISFMRFLCDWLITRLTGGAVQRQRGADRRQPQRRLRQVQRQTRQHQGFG